MNSPRTRGAFAIASAILVAGLLISVSLFATKTSTVTTTTTSTVTLTSQFVGSPSDLDLQVSAAKSGPLGTLDVSIGAEEVNTANTFNNVTAAESWLVSGLSNGACKEVYPLGIAVYRGNYTAQTIGSATPLTIFEPPDTNGTYLAAAQCNEFAFAASFAFNPHSDYASVTFSLGGSNLLPLSLSTTLDGYYVGSNLTSFSAGTYTVLAGDEWGHVSISYVALY